MSVVRGASRAWPAILVAGLLAGTPTPVQAGDITAFVALPAPTNVWGRGYGATLSSTWFQALNLEGEAARLRGDSIEASMTTFTGSALLAPPIGIFTPYGGLGVGLFRQSLGNVTDTGTLRAFVLGAKVKLGLVVLKGEYRRLTLHGTPLLPMTARISAGAGITF
jgi:hypothetical protein